MRTPTAHTKPRADKHEISFFFFFSSRRRHTRCLSDWSSDVCSSDLEIAQHFGLDPYQQYWFSTTDPTIEAVQHHVEGTVSTMDDYLRIRPSLYPDHSCAISAMQPWARRQAEGEAVVWTTLEGF